NRSYRVYAQAEPQLRGEPSAIGSLYVRSSQNGLTPLENLVKLQPATAPSVITHFNLFRSVELNGAQAPGVSSGQAIAEMAAAAGKVLGPGMGYEWAGLSWDEVRSGSTALVIFVLALLFVYLVLSAQYESFALPLIILLAVPLA